MEWIVKGFPTVLNFIETNYEHIFYFGIKYCIDNNICLLERPIEDKTIRSYLYFDICYFLGNIFKDSFRVTI